ncbi:vacuolar protein sorting-associated protein 51, putative [Plasmodium chabaudi adami]|uniref:Vacuolar protein sorting-associated protein 51, putative n=1 Tax=Plasmodium chabaudi adami TaxID=5826 RepID=A0A1C6X8Q0_PLACE|nr:vacuolar protein sorting-associated protein 51, putative [Plasmodium chabaudi adami]
MINNLASKRGGRKSVGYLLNEYYNVENESREIVTDLKIKNRNENVVKGYVSNTKLRKDGNESNTKTKDGPSLENVETLNEMDELNKKSSEFNADIYFRRLLEKSTLDELINRSKKMEKEIKQNDHSIQSIVYENYNKFIYAGDTVVLLKNSFKDVKEKINLINQHIDCIGNSFKKTNNSISSEIEQVENIIQIKKLLKNIHTIMQTPKKMYSLIVVKKYIEALKLFIELIPFLYQNRHINSFACLYMDCNNLANIACSLYFKFLHSATPNVDKNENGINNELNKKTEENNMHNDVASASFYENNLKNSFQKLCSSVIPNDEIASCFEAILSYGKEKKVMRNLFIQNRIIALKYLLCNIFNLKNYAHNNMEDVKDDERDDDIFFVLENNSNIEKAKIGLSTFENITTLVYEHLLLFFFEILDSYENVFLKNENSSSELTHSACTTKLISELNEASIKQSLKSGMVYEKKKKKNDDPTILMDEHNYHELKEMWDTNCDEEVIIIFTKSFFRTLLKLKIDLLYVCNPSGNMIVCCLKRLINNVKQKENEMKVRKSKLSSVLSPILNSYIEKLLYTIMKNHFYKLCYKNILNIISFYNMCNNNDIHFIVENKNELHHKILLTLCLEVIDLKIFYEDIKEISSDFFIKNIINFVTIYFIFLNKFLSSFMDQFICVYDRVKDHENENADANFGEPIYENPFLNYKNIYSINCELDEVKNEEAKMSPYKVLSNYFYNSVDINNVNIQDVLKKIKTKLNIDYKEFINKLVEENASKLNKINKTKEIYFLLTLVSIFNNFKKEGISKIFTILLDIYNPSSHLVKGNKKLYFSYTLESIFYKDVYPFNFKTGVNSVRSDNFDSDKFDEDSNKTNCKHDTSNNLGKNDEAPVLNDGDCLENVENTSLCKNRGQSLDSTSALNSRNENKMKNKFEDSESDWSEDTSGLSENEKIEKDKWTKSIKKFSKNIFHNKCNELANIYIFYYVNRISNNIELCLERWRENIEENSNMISSSFLYVLKNVNDIYFTLNLILGGDKTKDVNKYTYFEEVCKKIKKEINKTIVKEDNPTCTIDNDSNNFKDTNMLSQNGVNIKGSENLEMYMYKLYIAKMKNYKRNIKFQTKQIIFIIIKIVFKNYMEYVRNIHINEYIFKNLKIDFVFYFYFLKHYISKDDENLLFVILNDVLISAVEKMNKQVIGSNHTTVYPTYLLDNFYYEIDKNIDLIQNKVIIK